MAIAEGVTEIQDSEEEPMTSSPIKLPEIVGHKLSADGPGTHQESQDAIQDFNDTQQAHAEQIGAVSGGLDGLPDSQKHNLGVVVESKIDMQANIPMQPEDATVDMNQEQSNTDKTLKMESSKAKTQLHAGQNSESASLAFVIGETEQSSTSQVIPKDSLSVARHSSPPQKLHSSSVAACSPFAQALEYPSTPKLEYMNEKSQQMQPDHNVQAGIRQADNDAVSDFAVIASRSIPTAIMEHSEHMDLASVPIDDAHTKDPGVEVNIAALSMEMDVPTNHHVPAQIASCVEHDLFHPTAVPILNAMEDTIHEQPKEALLEFHLLVGAHPIGKIVIDPPVSGKLFATDERGAGADKCGAPILVNEPVSDTQASPGKQSVNLSAQVVHNSLPPPDQLFREEQLQEAQDRSPSGTLKDTTSSAAAAPLDARNDSFLATTGSTATAHLTTLESSSISSTQPVVPKTPQEITLAELKAQKAALLASLVALPAVQVVIEEQGALNAGSLDEGGEPAEADVMAAANKIVREHIKLLHEYNELKDMGQGLMGLIADQRGVRIVEVQSEFGIEAQD